MTDVEETAPGETEEARAEEALQTEGATEVPIQEGKEGKEGAAEPDYKAEAARLKDQLLRTAADFDNFRKRSRREAEDALRRGREGLLKDFLPVFDNLERAAASAESATDVKSVAEGVRIVMKQFESTLERVGIKKVPAVGKPFDPSVHDAIQHVESEGHPAGIVVYEVEPGYAVGDYLVRPAKVVVSKGPPGGREPAAS